MTAAPAIAEDMVKILVEREGTPLKADYKPGREIKAPFRTMTMEERQKAIEEDPDYAKIVCRCEQVTEAEIRDAIRRPVGARSVSARQNAHPRRNGPVSGRLLQPTGAADPV